jgi:hypothetical protein
MNVITLDLPFKLGYNSSSSMTKHTNMTSIMIVCTLKNTTPS